MVPNPRTRRSARPQFLSMLLVVLMIASLFGFASPVAAAVPPSGYRNAVDLNLLTHDSSNNPTYGGYTYNADYSGANAGGPFPLDSTVTPNSEPSMKIATWWDWSGSVTLSGWNTYSIANYYQNGYLTFQLKTNVNNAYFRVQLVSQNTSAGNEVFTTPITVTATTNWTTVNIRVKDRVDSNTNFLAVQTQQVRFSGDPPASATNKPTYWINGLRYTTTDLESSAAPIKVNQLGYAVNAEKYALVSGFQENLDCASKRFDVNRSDTGASVYNSTTTLVSDYEGYVSGERICKADFSSFKTPGTYYVSMTGLANSSSFTINDNTYNSLLRDATRYFYLQRQGIAINNAGSFNRALGHPNNDSAAYFRSKCTWDSSTGTTRDRYKDDPCGGGLVQSGATTVDVSGGWYDAGDYGKYVAYATEPVIQLVDAYELNPASFADSTLNIPESGNGKPDLLDEVKWELDWVLKMQNSTSGGFYNTVYPNNCGRDNAGTVYCSPDQITTARLQRYVNDVDSNGNGGKQFTASTAAAAALLARASMVFQNVDSTYATTLRNAAENAWTFLTNNTSNIVPKYGQASYSDAQEKEFRLLAAAALFRATTDATKRTTYNNYFLAHYNDSYDANTKYLDFWSSSRNSTALAQYAHLIYFADPNADTTAKSNWTTSFNSWRSYWINYANTSPWRNFLKDGSDGKDSSYYWGSTPLTLEYGALLMKGSRILGSQNDPDLIKAVRASFNYALGANPLNKSYVTGYGTNAPTKLYSHIYSYDSVTTLPAGYLVEGPNEYDGGKAYSRFRGKTYADNDTDWTTSEQGIYYNSRLVYTAAWLKTVAEYTIYDDSLSSGWQNWSWSTTADFAQTTTRYSGSSAIAVTYTGAWAGFYLHNDTAQSTASYTGLRFWIHGGSSAHALRVYLYNGSGTAGTGYTFNAPANTWTQVIIPLSSLGSPSSITGVVWQDNSGASGTQSTYYLDAIGLVP